MKLYIAAHSQEEARAVAKLCREAGHEITSRWLEEDFSKTGQYTDADKTLIADNDADDVEKSEALVLLPSPRRIPGGKFVEAGIALGQLKMVYVLGHRENMLLYHHLVRQFDSAEDFLKAVADGTAARTQNREYANERRKNIERLDPDRYQKLIQKEREVARVKRLDRTYREKGMISNKKWVAAKRKSDPVFRAVSSIRCVINYALRGKAKAGHSLELIGCTPDFLRQHLENLFDIGMTWKNYGHGHGKWCVDHKRPCASFDLSKPIQQKKCFHYTNLRPLWFIENIIKGSSYKGKRHKHITKT